MGMTNDYMAIKHPRLNSGAYLNRRTFQYPHLSSNSCHNLSCCKGNNFHKRPFFNYRHSNRGLPSNIGIWNKNVPNLDFCTLFIIQNNN